jgi:hypothetical protein
MKWPFSQLIASIISLSPGRIVPRVEPYPPRPTDLRAIPTGQFCGQDFLKAAEINGPFEATR